MTAVSNEQSATPGVDGDLRALFGQSIAVFASLGGPEHRVEAADPAFFAAIGMAPPRTGDPLVDLLPELADQGFIELLAEVYRSGERYTGRDVRVVLGRGAQEREAFFDFTYEPRRDAAGRVAGVHVIGVETTQVKQAQRLTAEHRALLEQIALQAPLAEVLDGMARTIERLTPQEVLVSVLLADADGRHLRHGAAPGLPAFYNEAIDGIATGEGVGSCGTAAHRREPVIVTDIGTDPFWADFRDLAGRAGLAACWSTPILARDGSLLGTFAMYHRTPRVPQETDLALNRIFAGTAALAIERHHIEQAKAEAEARARAAHDALAKVVRAERELRAEAEERAAAAADLAARMRSAAAAQGAAPHPENCQLGGASGCTEPAEIKIADSWGDSAWGCPVHVEEAIINVRSVFIASEELGGLATYVNR
ncbi:diguanylate cyclase [Actinoplanes sp. SE50]|uniref:GAF domain-containing protein n=1 Tax=unclassified Actinoplanes TaxID=2626549 RepID=UPI00023EC967|nr:MULTISPECIES: GAF domain-containing protein [unclassified Actinoplanes]AEV84247.1 diguanylate cyclase/phosphodiesterase with PAS/PAC and GAF sensor(s) [Actinoplanes sp. SE50/110]ATO82639.1 diguanylate cyclase [Actinoplanes sp. SE50]SLM00046.1 diguanylate cyclase [Actinoplanes sp. SE50/110]